MHTKTEPILVTNSVIEDLEKMKPKEAQDIANEMLRCGLDESGKWHQPQGWRGPWKPNPWQHMEPIDLDRAKHISAMLATVSIIIGLMAAVILLLYFAPQIDAWTLLQ